LRGGHESAKGDERFRGAKYLKKKTRRREKGSAELGPENSPKEKKEGLMKQHQKG